MLSQAVICEPLRTPIGQFGGQFKNVSAHELGRTVLAALLARCNGLADRIDDVIFAQCYPSMEAPALGRVVALDAGLPVESGGYQLDRRCGSGLQAVINAVMQVATGASSIVIAGGAESMSNAPFFMTGGRWGIKGSPIEFHDGLTRGRVTAGGINFPVPGGMLETAENLRKSHGIPRESQDRFAVESHRRAVAAQENGLFGDEIVPVTVRDRKGETVVAMDEHPRPDASLERLSKLVPIRIQLDPDSTVTAGNASGQNDGASACVVTTATIADELGLRPYARLVSWAVAGVPPEIMGIGPVPATAKALARADLAMKDLDLIELNEAFAAQTLACTKDWGFSEADFERLNVNGSGISLGHPVGATGGRILATLLREMERRGTTYGLETMCIGGGQGLAAVFRRV